MLCLKASVVAVSCKQKPSRTATPMAVRSISARMSAMTSPGVASCSSTVSVAMTTSAASPDTTFCRISPAVPAVMVTVCPVSCRNDSASSATMLFMAPALSTLTSTASLGAADTHTRSVNRTIGHRFISSSPRHDIAIAEIAPEGPVLLVGLLHGGEAIGGERRTLLVLVEPRVGLAEDDALDGPVGGAERLEAVLLLHVLRDLEPPQRLDLPLGRAGPHRVGAPHHAVGPQPAHELAHHGRAHARIGHGALGKDLAKVSVDVVDAVLARGLREVRHPLDAPGLLELRPGVVRLAAAGEAVGRVVDDEVELRPVLGRLAHVSHVGVGEEMRELLLDGWREEPLVDADIDEAGLGEFLVGLVGDLLVVQTPRVLADFFVGLVADVVALERIRLESVEGAAEGPRPPRVAGV